MNAGVECSQEIATKTREKLDRARKHIEEANQNGRGCTVSWQEGPQRSDARRGNNIERVNRAPWWGIGRNEEDGDAQHVLGYFW